MNFPTAQQHQQTSFPELTGRSVQEATSYISGRGLTPVLVKPNQPVTMDYRMDRVRIATDESGSVVVGTPTLG